ncbi:60S ribosomal export protein NMD3 [Gracilariopsis chorda]|uniref:60S ribosomal export protein NMD3 n=1 Tax=Gracilariopsis chorda TaxID=448386 RepID=A0A2V3INH7_9FLOR|nr:60S ribosomal export protein NMD3 [Gracilariopsis chorda]|eukprot:PXF43613.1 60S ribosomal export protein NMD3 [Gracilariopsis chorda]
MDSMDLDSSGVPPRRTLPTILCCLCGVPITANPSNMCINCIRGQVDITENIPKTSTIYYCKGCARYLQPPKHWVAAELESKELLALCIKRLKGLNKVKLVDAGFRWTEPHSRRIQVRLLVQKEVFNNTILQQEFFVEFIVEYQQCDMCKRDAADIDEWQAVVQVRQKVVHKRTFLFLEQLIIKHGAHEDTVGIKAHPDGLDFYFLHRSHAMRFVSFLNHVVPIRTKQADHLVSHDTNSNTYRYKYTFSVEILPLCKDDVACLPPKVHVLLGGIGPLVLITKVSTSLSLIDPFTLQTAELAAPVYWKYPFQALMSFKQGTEFAVLDVEKSRERKGKWCLADVTVARSIDYGKNDSQHYISTHLGNFLNPGDLALGYDLGNAVFNESLLAGHKRLQLPDFLLFKKTYSKKNRSKRRMWRLKRLNMELDDAVVETAYRKSNLDPIARMAAEQEEFLQDLEQDQDLRTNINIYRDPTKFKPIPSQMDVDQGNPVPAATQNRQVVAEDGDEDDEDYPEVPIEELLEGLNIEDGPDDFSAPSRAQPSS